MYSWEYVLGYIFVGVIITAFGAFVIASATGLYKRFQKRKERERKQQELLDRLAEAVKVFEPIQVLVVYLTKEQLKQEARYYTEKEVIPLHHKTELLSLCNMLHNIPGTNGDVTEIKNRLLELETVEVG